MRRYIPSKTKLVKSFKLRCKEYLLENSLAGVPYFVNPQRPTWERVLWFTWTLVSLCGAIGVSWIIWQQFQTNPTIVSISMETESLILPYPSIYICMSSEYLNFRGLSKELEKNFILFYNWNWKQINVSNKPMHETLSAVMLRRTPSCSSLLSNCTDGRHSVSCGSFFKKTITPAGVCCQSRMKKLYKGDDADNITVSFTRPINNNRTTNLYLMQGDDDGPVRFSQVSYRLNREVKMTIEFLVTQSSADVRSLPYRQRQCTFADEAPLYRTCLFRCFRDAVIETCNCYPWFIKGQHNADECTPKQYECLVKNKDTLRSLKCYSSCFLPCHHTSYVFSDIKNSNRTEINIRWPMYSYMRHLSFGWLDLIVSFGGIMGVFLGYSLITTIELIYYITLRPFCAAVIDDDDDDNDVKVVQVAEKKKPVLTEIYYDYTN